MRKNILPLILLFSFILISSLDAQNFTWIKGSNQADQSGAYGNIGITTATNNPGARTGAVSWTDASGNFWLFGGSGRDFIGNSGYLNDLWKYTPSTNQWVWVKGDNIIAQPGIYGTQGVNSPTNAPGGRSSATGWLDNSGNLWLFGGYGYGSSTGLGQLNDLWRYNISTNIWTWVSGANTNYQAASYGTLTVSSPSNMPGSRYGAKSWADASGDLWLFGGIGNTTNSVSIGALNDLWKYTIGNNQWTWMNGTSSANQNGTYGTLGVPNPANMPGGRSYSQVWRDASGNFWLMGGDGYDALAPTSGPLSDLWKFDPIGNAWTWVKGSSNQSQNGTYGLQGAASATTVPGGRFDALTWVDAVGTLWLLGGEGLPSSGVITGKLNDLWKYSITTNNWTWVRGSSIVNQAGNNGSIGVAAFTNIPGGRRGSVSWMDGNSNLWFLGGNGYPNGQTPGGLSDLWKYTNCFIAPITLTITSADSVICAGETTSLTVIGSNNYLWSLNTATTSFLLIKPNQTTTYSVTTTDNNSCAYTFAFTETVQACTGINSQDAKDAALLLYPNPNKGSFKLELINESAEADLLIFNNLGQTVFEQKLSGGQSQIQTNLSTGIYYYELRQNSLNTRKGKLIIEN